MSDEDFNQTEEDYESYSVGTLFGRSFLEKLLLAIIKAHPIGEDTPESRLRNAMRALTGENSKARVVAQDGDLPALLFMGHEHHVDKGNKFLWVMKHRREKNPPKPPKIRKDLALAKEATDKFFNPPNEQARKAIYDRLREKFSGSYYRKRGKGEGINFREYFVYQAVEHDYVAETLEAQSLDLICKELRENGVKTSR
ncbi:hypothetical protein [Ruegeria atlantica]|uniref:hypothetical protein n=1 Tax=Ruegeria atlantica TaxID=81569 RepID=UPI00147C7EB1|nr:hypothetical protein [Ruegeria atlantica]